MNFSRNNFSNFDTKSRRHSRYGKLASRGSKKTFKPKKKNNVDINNLNMFPNLSENQVVVAEPCENKTTFLQKTQTCDIKDEQKDENLETMNNLPMGWVRLSKTNPSSPTKKEIEWQEKRDEFEKKKKMVKDIWSSLRHIQKERNEYNEVLGSNSPYYDMYNILGPPGESDDEYEDDEYYSTSENSEDEYEYE